MLIYADLPELTSWKKVGDYTSKKSLVFRFMTAISRQKHKMALTGWISSIGPYGIVSIFFAEKGQTFATTTWNLFDQLKPCNKTYNFYI